MKIPLTKGFLLGAERDIATFTVIGKNFHIITRAIVDTGSPFTILMENDLKRTRIPYTQLPKLQKVNLGPIAIFLIDLGDCDLLFRDVDNNPITLKHKIYGGVIAQRNLQIIQILPSILGRDFLVKYNFDIKRDEEGNVYLQT
jgi:hypothetical protein